MGWNKNWANSVLPGFLEETRDQPSPRVTVCLGGSPVITDQLSKRQMVLDACIATCQPVQKRANVDKTTFFFLFFVPFPHPSSMKQTNKKPLRELTDDEGKKNRAPAWRASLASSLPLAELLCVVTPQGGEKSNSSVICHEPR